MFVAESSQTLHKFLSSRVYATLALHRLYHNCNGIFRHLGSKIRKIVKLCI